ncbi:DUF930 domain-containing protein [Oricola thermophila]|uniref:DUF930 domain-containing protein n=1 Tax=Oricola thermophila TaxID=2742145 RepID=A0A6N1VI22_9HYPH|nr:DUF930 domain-containing protein [Oricola thermophila]QKV18799.1 DUF930 domain-containing protein [Oricola thermophila]
MHNTQSEPAAGNLRGLVASLAAHAVLAALLVFGLPAGFVPPDPPEAVAVELVPPPEEEPAPDEPPAEDEPAEEPPPAEADAVARINAQPIQVLRPVFRFGERNAGPEIAEDGNAPEEPAPEEAAEEPAPEDAVPGIAVPAEKPPLELAQARTLFSRAVSRDLAAMDAMGTLTRGERGAELCTTELREQLRHAEPPVWPELLPAYRLGEGTAIEVRDGAFRASGQWYGLSFRCEVDADATQVVAFAFSVGAAIPRSEWEARGFPGF